ncbi:MAG: TlpA family protein disulfide reductase [Mucilaginibacter sp.]|nr:TlpA family protein disulfide reductase [Mucilaginibacter sp.]
MIKTFKICFAVSFFAVTSYGQSAVKKRMFADTELLIKQYILNCQKAWDNKDEKRALTYYDSINSCINNTYLENYRFKTLTGKVIDLGRMNKPVFMTVSASWCAPCKAEIPVLNKIAEEYKEKIDFIVLFWDTPEETAKLALQYSNVINIVPSPKRYKGDDHEITISGFKHFRGFPASYMIATDKQIVKYQEGATPISYIDAEGKEVNIGEKKAFEANYQRLKTCADFLVNHKVSNK